MFKLILNLCRCKKTFKFRYILNNQNKIFVKKITNFMMKKWQNRGPKVGR